MKELIYKYLLDAGRPVAADEILLAVLKIRSPNALAADKVLRTILHKDRRFTAAHGLWQLRARTPSAPQPDLESISCLSLERGRASSETACVRGALLTGKTGSLWEFDFSPGTPIPEIKALKRMVASEGNTTLAAWTGGELRLWNRLLDLWHIEAWTGNPLAVRNLAARAFSRPASDLDLEIIAGLLGLPAPDAERPAKKAQFLASCIPLLLGRAPEESGSTLAAVQAWIDQGPRLLISAGSISAATTSPACRKRREST